MLILLTNDDGISAPGLVALYHELTSMGEVQVVAPATVQSAAGHGITLSTPLLTSRVTVPDPRSGKEAFTGIAVEGRPADCVKLAISHFLPRAPDLVVSGLNAGANVGINVVYSGTVAAAIEAAFLGLPAIAASVHLKSEVATDYHRPAKLARETIGQVLNMGLKPGQTASINVPALKANENPRGVKVVRQCTRPWTDTYERRKDPRGRDYFWNNSVFSLGESDEDTDVAALREGWITVTPLSFDLTDWGVMEEWRGSEEKMERRK